MKHLQKIIDAYLKNNIPFAVFKYPNAKPTIIAQYSTNFIIDKVDLKKTGFLIHPFIKDKKTPIAFIKPDVFTTDFDTINLTNLPHFNKQQFIYNESVIDFSSYKKTLQKQLTLLQTNVLQKVIASRIVELAKIEQSVLARKFEQLCIQNPNAFCYVFNLPGIGLWLGASPEILLQYENNVAKTVALAGTKKIEKAETWGAKEIEEQQYVGSYIENICDNLSLQIINKSETETINAGTIQHLKTSYHIKIEKENVLALVEALHPTPAVAGLPKQKAIQVILESESYDRQYYTGYLGMIEANKIQLQVNLRCAKISVNKTLAFVGGGITKNSDIEKEWDETVAKSGTIASIM